MSSLPDELNISAWIGELESVLEYLQDAESPDGQSMALLQGAIGTLKATCCRLAETGYYEPAANRDPICPHDMVRPSTSG